MRFRLLKSILAKASSPDSFQYRYKETMRWIVPMNDMIIADASRQWAAISMIEGHFNKLSNDKSKIQAAFCKNGL